MASTSNVLGVVVLSRHGDRLGFYQSPTTYTPSLTSITPLGEAQEYALGSLLRSIYINPDSVNRIQGISTGLFDQTQVLMRADAGGEGGVIFDSAVALAQGLWPANPSSNITLSDGTTAVSPLGGYQYVPIESVEPGQDVSLEGWTSCTAFTDTTAELYASPPFAQMATDNADFLASLRPYVDGRPVSLENMWNIFDYMNVQSIHNKTFASTLPPTILAQARDLANFHEYNTFSSSQPNGIRNIAGLTILPSIFSTLDRISNASDPLKFASMSISYKPFISLFNMTGMAQGHPELAGIVDYASAFALELRSSSSSSEPTLRLNFKNGSALGTLTNYAEMPYSQFKDQFEPYGLALKGWCHTCNNRQDRGCDRIASSAANDRCHAGGMSATAAGFAGMGATLGTVLLAVGALWALGLLKIGRSARRNNRGHEADVASDTLSARSGGSTKKF